MKVLVVDDSKVMRSIVMRTLRQAGFACDSMEEAADGPSALKMIESSRPDVVLTDWNMPGMPGIDLLRTVRAKGDSTRFIFVTSEGTDEMRRSEMARTARLGHPVKDARPTTPLPRCLAFPHTGNTPR